MRREKPSMSMRLAFAVAMLLASPALAAAGPADDLSQGIRLYDDLQPDLAVPALERAFAGVGATAAQRASARLYLGLAKAVLGEETAARAAFAEAFALSPELSLPPSTPRDVAALAEASRPARPAPPAVRSTTDALARRLDTAARVLDRAIAETVAPLLPPPPPPASPATAERGADGPRAAAADGAAKPARPGGGLCVGVGMRYFYIPDDKTAGPALDALIGYDGGRVRLEFLASWLAGDRNAALVGVRFTFGPRWAHAGVDLGLGLSGLYLEAAKGGGDPSRTALVLTGHLAGVWMRFSHVAIVARAFSVDLYIPTKNTDALFRVGVEGGITLLYD